MAANELFDTGIKVTGSFSAAGAFPVDGKYVVETVAERDDHVTQNRAYDGMQVYVKADKTTYQYHADSNSWSVFHDDAMYTHAVTNKGVACGESQEDGTILPGLYKLRTNAEGHVVGVEKVTKEDIAGLGVKITDNDTTYSDATEESSGLLSAADKKKLDGIAENANNYTHPSGTPQESGFYKFEVDGTGHVKSTTKVVKKDITDLGIPESDTTYGTATTEAAGLMSPEDKQKLDGMAEGATDYTHPTHQQYAEGFYKITVNNLGHITKATVVTADDITNLVSIPDAPDVVEITQQEYDDLSEEEKMNGKMYLITDADLDTYTNIVEITQEEYDALSQAEKMNGTMYMITDGVSERYTALKEITQEEYDALPESEKMNGTLYFITDESTPVEAKGVTFDNSDTGLESTDVQGAIVELKGILGDVEAILATI